MFYRAILLFLLPFTTYYACPFCSDLIMEEQSIFETQYFKVLVDLNPRTEGHLLIVSKRHVPKAHELSSEEWSDLAETMPKVIELFSRYFHSVPTNPPPALPSFPYGCPKMVRNL